MTAVLRTQIEVQKDALINTRQVDSNVDLDAHENAALLEVQTFGFSANNITYALLGDRFGYWGFFPASEGYGITPVWGFAKVIQTNSDKLKVGELVYGYLPMATHLVVHADKIMPHGFSDANPQRRSISPVYDQYLRCDKDPSYSEAMESWILTFRPLFTTSFVLAYALAERMSAHKGRIFMTSASSKTAYGTAQILREIMPDVRLLGLTSSGQKDFVEQTACFDDVIVYDQLTEETVAEADWILDFAGDQRRLSLLRKGHSTAKERTILIGATDVEAQTAREKLSIGNVFFAPDEVRNFNKAWGSEEFQKRYFHHWQSFVTHFKPLLKEESQQGAQAIVKQFQQFLSGKVDPTVMHVLKF